jgi:hypothetical protein
MIGRRLVLARPLEPSMRRPNLLVPLAVLMAAVLLAGCGQSAEEVLQAASANTTAAGSSRVVLDVKVAGDSAAKTVSLTGTGAFDYAKRKGTLDLSVPLSGPDAPPAKIQSIIDGDVVYQKYPRQLSAQLAAGKPWLKIDLALLNRVGAGGATSGQPNDPTQALNFLKGVTGKVDEVGKEKVRDAQTTHYSATLDLEKAATDAGKNKDTITNLIEQTGSKTIPADVWIDEDGRLRKMRYELTMKGSSSTTQAGAAATKVTTTIELYEFGIAVQATLPPASQVTDATKLLLQ